jgi:hypothetical protein
LHVSAKEQSLLTSSGVGTGLGRERSHHHGSLAIFIKSWKKMSRLTGEVIHGHEYEGSRCGEIGDSSEQITKLTTTRRLGHHRGLIVDGIVQDKLGQTKVWIGDQLEMERGDQLEAAGLECAEQETIGVRTRTNEIARLCEDSTSIGFGARKVHETILTREANPPGEIRASTIEQLIPSTLTINGTRMMIELLNRRIQHIIPRKHTEATTLEVDVHHGHNLTHHITPSTGF